ncbi:MAG: FG-GAP-like repeat-containing protein [Bacteroidota bacterium]
MKAIKFLFFLFLPLLSFAQFLDTSTVILEFKPDFTFVSYADINSDGKDDIFAVHTNKIFLLKNDGTGNFMPDTLILTANSDIEWAEFQDINGDSISDLIVITDNKSIEIWSKNDSLSFVLQNTLVLPYPVISKHKDKSISIVDINNDGLKDLITGSEDYGLSYFIRTSGYNFQARVTFPDFVDALLTADLNNDGWVDIVFSRWENFYVKLNSGTGTFFGPSLEYGNPNVFGTNRADIELIDYDLDLDLDVVLLLDDEGKIILYPNSNGVFSVTGPTIPNLGNIYNLVKQDLNNDSIIDITFKQNTTTTPGHNNTTTGNIKYCLGNGVSFDSKLTLYSGIIGESPTDFSNQTGSLNKTLLLCGLDGIHSSINVVRETTPFVYDSITNFSNWWYIDYKNLFFADFNQDSLKDIAKFPITYSNISNETYDIYYDSSIYFLNNLYYHFLANGDLNGDAIEDLVGFIGTQVGYRLGTGNGLYSSEFQTLKNNVSYCSQINIFDVNHDGLLDIYFIINENAVNKLFYVINQGNGVLGNAYQTMFSIIFDRIAFNENGNYANAYNLDFTFSSGGSLYVKTVSNPEPIFIKTISNLNDLKTSDVDMDGLTDIVYQDLQTIGWIKNMDLNNFQDQGIICPNAKAFLAKDIDNDGDPDFLYRRDSVVEWMENNGYGNFGTAQFLTDQAENDGIDSRKTLYAEDIDNDLDLDVLFVGKIPNGSGPNIDGDLKQITNHLNGSNEISGFAFYDLNENGFWDSNETAIENMAFKMNGYTTDITNPQGEFIFRQGEGTYNLTYNPIPNWSLRTDSLSYTFQFNQEGILIDSLLFGLSPDTLFTQCTPDLTGGRPRCNTEANYWISTKNTGTVPTSTIIELILDDSLSFVSSSNTPDSIVGNHLFWHYDSIALFNSHTFPITVLMPDFQSMNDTLKSIVINYVIDSTGTLISEKRDTLSQILVCAYDPNDKTVLPQGITEIGFIPNNQKLEYLIRFQNTGNDTAFHVKIKDILHENVNPLSVEVISSSNPVELTYSSNNTISFDFYDIELPDSNTNYLTSQGFIKFSVELKPGLSAGEQILNRAEIYFDQNPAVITNMTINTIFDCQAPISFNQSSVDICPGNQFQISQNTPWLTKYEWYLNDSLISNESGLQYNTTTNFDTIVFKGSNYFCTVDTIFTPTFYPAVILNLSENDSISLCDGVNLELNANENENNFWYFSNNLISESDSLIITQSGWYFLNADNGFCQASDSLYVNYFNIDLQQPDTSNICSGDNLVLHGNFGADNLWYFNDNFISNNDSIIANQTGWFKVITNNTFCQWSDSIYLIYHQIDLQQPDTLEFCNGDFFNLYAGLDDNNSWFFNDLLISNSDSISTTQTGMYTLISENLFCTSKDSTYLIFHFIDLQQADSIDLCVEESLVLKGNDNGNNLWYFNNNLLSDSDSIIANQSGWYKIIADNSFCQWSDSIKLIYHQIDLQQPDTLEFCNGEFLNLYGGIDDNNSWFFNDLFISNSDSISTSQTGMYTLISENLFCTSKDSTYLIFHFTDLQIADSIDLCVEESIVLKGNDNGNNLWYFNNNLLSDSDSIIANQSGWYKIIADNSFCQWSDSIKLIYHQIDLQQPDTLELCAGQNLLLYANLDNNNSWFYNDLLISNNDTITTTQTGMYTLISENIFCTSKDSTYLMFHFTDLQQSDSIGLCNQEDLVLKGNINGNNLWYFNNDFFSDSDSIIVNQNGWYKIIADNSFCQWSDSVFLDFLIVAFQQPDSVILCPGENLILQGDSLQTNFWYFNDSLVSNNDTLICSQTGNYLLLSNNGFCEAMDSLYISNNQMINNITINYESEHVSLYSNLTNVTFNWLDCDNFNSMINDADTNVFITEENGSFALLVIDNYGCSDTSECVIINNIGIDDNLTDEIKIYPIPTSDYLHILTDGLTIDKLVVKNNLGEELSVQWNSIEHKLNLENFSSGVYFIEIKIKSITYYRKFIIVND